MVCRFASYDQDERGGERESRIGKVEEDGDGSEGRGERADGKRESREDTRTSFLRLQKR